MIIRSFAVMTAFLAIGCSQALACSCISKGNFIEYANQSEGVIQAKVVSYGDKLSHGETLYDSMVVKVIAVVRGDFKFDSLILMGDPGHLCRDYVDSKIFVIGKEYLIAIHGNDAVQPFGGCGESWLAINNGVAEGHIWAEGRPQKYTLPMPELFKTLKRK